MNPIDKKCPTCNADIGHPCRTTIGKHDEDVQEMSLFHRSRQQYKFSLKTMNRSRYGKGKKRG